MSSYLFKWSVFTVFGAAIAGLWLGGPLSREQANIDDTISNTAEQANFMPVGIESPDKSPANSDNSVPGGTTRNKPEFTLDVVVDDNLARQAALLTNGRYEQAVELYSELYANLSETKSRKYRDAIVAFAESLATQGDHKAVLSLIGVYTNLFYKDIHALSLLAGSQHVLKRYPEEIDTLLLALNEAWLEDDIKELNTKLEYAIIAQDLIFVQRNDPDSAVEFYRSLLLVRPDSVELQLGLARAMIKAGAVDQAVVALSAMPETMGHAGQIERLLEIAKASRPVKTTAIPMQRTGESYVVEATINEVETVRLLIDTGATLTIIRPDALRRAGVGSGQYEATRTLTTAGGRVSAPIYRISSISLGTEVASNIAVGSIDIPGLGSIDGLLGMDFLDQFSFSIDQGNQVILLTR